MPEKQTAACGFSFVPCSVFSAFALESLRSCALAFVCSSAGQHGTRHTIAYSEAERLVQTKMFES